IDARDRIWVGYYDEGVYGNFGWGNAQGSAPIGAAGLLCFDRSGKKIWEYDAPEDVGTIDDCYALNVSSSGVWAYHYSDFPLVRVDCETMDLSTWSTPGHGGGALATNGEAVLLYGGYDTQRGTCRLFELRHGAALLRADVSLVLPEGSVADPLVIGR